MHRTEHLLTIAIEECAELQKELCKALRFGIGDQNPDDPERTPNHTKIIREMTDLVTVMEMLSDTGLFPETESFDEQGHVDRKKEKVERHLRYSNEKGTLTP